MSILASCDCCCSPMRTSASITMHGVDPLALGRAAFQLISRPHRLRRQVHHRCRSRADGAARTAVVSGPNCARWCAPSSSSGSWQGPDSVTVSGAGALWRQSRGHSRGLDRLFRQGAEAAVAGGSRAAGGAAAVAGKPPARSLSRMSRAPRATACSTAWSKTASFRGRRCGQAKAVPVPRLRKPMPILAPHSADQAVAAVKAMRP
jgi:hypothetical protein